TQGDGPQASALTTALSTARKQLEVLGGRLRVTTSPPGWTGAALSPSPAVSSIQQRIKALFDPGGVFGSEPPGGTGSGEGTR
ncbi:MAG: hypothetical protein HKO53_08120, partial [Gemmatimonadetes bacterium]|nr:hypothetical protein [Gemmatimonadota bacterium]